MTFKILFCFMSLYIECSHVILYSIERVNSLVVLFIYLGCNFYVTEFARNDLNSNKIDKIKSP